MFSAGVKSELNFFCDSDWAGCLETRRSTTGFIGMFAGTPIIWSSKRQSMISLSSAEAEYIALSSCAKTITWMRRLFTEFMTGYPCTDEPNTTPTQLFTDSTSAKSLATKKQVNQRNKHISLKVHHIWELLDRGICEIQYIDSRIQPADILTKPLDKLTLMQMCDLMKLIQRKR